jgi:hypothetical protein
MSYIASEILVVIGVFAGLLACGEVGRFFVLRQKKSMPGASEPGPQAVESAVLTLLGLLLAFTFTGAATRFDHRRELIIEEANDIGTAYLRLDLLPAEERPAVQALLRRYLDGRIATYRKMPDIQAALKVKTETDALQGEIWSRAVAAAKSNPGQLGILLLPALNSTFDIASTRLGVTQIHPPMVIYAMLVAVAFVSAFLLGGAFAASGNGAWRPYMVLFGVLTTVMIFVIRDIEHPRLGLIRVDAADEILLQLSRSLGPGPQPAPSR